LEIIAAVVVTIGEEQRTIPLRFIGEDVKDDRERWYAGLVVCERYTAFENAPYVDVGYAKKSDSVILTAPGCERIVQKVIYDEHESRLCITNDGHGYIVVTISGEPTREQLRRPFGWIMSCGRRVVREAMTK